MNRLSRWLLLGALPSLLTGEEYRFRLAGEGSDLITGPIRHVFSGSGGRLWVTTPGGVVRFDGKQLEAFQPERTGAVPRDIRWVDFAGGLVYLRNGSSIHEYDGRFRIVVKGLQQGGGYNDGPFQTMAVDGQDTLWFTDGSRLMRLDRTANPVLVKDLGTPLHSIAFHPDGSLWLGCGQTLCRWAGNNLTRMNDLPAERYLSIAIHSGTGRIVARGQSRIVEQLADGRFQDTTGPLLPLLPDQPEPALAFDHQHRLLTNCEQGLARREADGWRFIRGPGMTSDLVRSIQVDLDGGVWVGTLSGGLHRWLGNGNWRIFTDADGLPRRGPETLTEDETGSIWMGTLGFGVYRGVGRDHVWKFSRVDSLGLAATVYSFGGWVWVAGRTGVRRYQPRTGAVVDVASLQLGLRGIRVMLHDGAGRLWAGGRAGLFRLSESGLSPELLPSGAREVLSMARHPDGTLWLGTDGGVVRWTPDGWVSIGPPRRVTAMAFVPEGLWWATNDRLELVSLAAGKMFQKVPGSMAFEGVAVRWIRAVRDEIWAGTERGMVVKHGLHWLRYGIPEGLPGAGSTAALERANGHYFVANSGGLLLYEPPVRRFRTGPPNVQIGTPLVGGRIAQVSELRNLPHNHAPLTIPFSIVTTRIGMATPARFRLLPSDTWLAATQDRLDLVSLSPGDYQLEIAAQGVNGEWTARPASIPIRVRPPWYQTTAARLGFAAVALAFAWGAAYAYRRREQLQVWALVQDMVDNFPMPVLILSSQGRFVFANQAAVTVANRPRASIVGQMLTGPGAQSPSAKQLQHGFERTTATGQVQRWEQLASDGRRTFQVSMFPLRDTAGKIHSVCCVSVDVTLERHYENDLRALSARRADLLEEERMHLSHEIHDDLGQQLTGTKMALSRLGRKMPEAAPQLDGIVRQVDGILESVRRLAQGLRPEMLDHLGLAAAIAREVEEFSRRTGIAATYSGPADTPALPPAMSLSIFRIVQESLTNIARHAQATRARVTLSIKAGNLSVAVADNGRGYPAEAGAAARPSGSLGILGMSERARSLGGSFEIGPAPGGGTLVNVVIPLPLVHPLEGEISGKS